jgi:hypothetical protein
MAVNIVLLRALIQTSILPISRQNLEQAICTKTKADFLDLSLKTFGLIFYAVAKN